MPDSGNVPSSAELLRQVRELLANFESELSNPDLRGKVLALVPAFRKLRSLGVSLVVPSGKGAAIDRILNYFNRYPKTVIAGDELMVVSGIGEWARRVRELRVELGWKIANGLTIREQIEEGDIPALLDGTDLSHMTAKEYILLSLNQDRDAAYRWNIANRIRKNKESVRNKVLEFLRANVGKVVSGEELRYVAGDKREWARRVRELRTEFGWPVHTKNSGRPDLAIGDYVLEEDRQAPEHDRKIPDTVRVEVLGRDKYRCTVCHWDQTQLHPGDPRHMLELHHIHPHAEGGPNEKDNLITLCNVHHDEIHRNMQ